MVQVGDRGYAWDDILGQVQRLTIYAEPTASPTMGRVPRRAIDTVEVIGTVREIDEDGFVLLDLATYPDTAVTEDGDFVFAVGTGPVMQIEDEIAELA